MGWQNTTSHFLSRNGSDGRALLDYFKRGCLHHHLGQPDTPSGVLGFVFILHLTFFQQAAGIHIQMLGKSVHCHIQLEGFGKLCRAAFPLAVLVRYHFCYRFQYRVRRLLPKLLLCMVEKPYQTLLVFA